MDQPGNGVGRHPEHFKSFKSLETKIAALEDLDSGLYDLKEVLYKYGTTRQNLRNWRKKLGFPAARSKKINDTDRRWAVHQIGLGLMTEAAVMAQYGIKGRQTIELWKLKFSGDIGPYMGEIKGLEDGIETSTPTDSDSENERLKVQVEALQFKVLGLETMIDVAEREIGVDIRKKSGAEQ